MAQIHSSYRDALLFWWLAAKAARIKDFRGYQYNSVRAVVAGGTMTKEEHNTIGMMIERDVEEALVNLARRVGEVNRKMGCGVYVDGKLVHEVTIPPLEKEVAIDGAANTLDAAVLSVANIAQEVADNATRNGFGQWVIEPDDWQQLDAALGTWKRASEGALVAIAAGGR